MNDLNLEIIGWRNWEKTLPIYLFRCLSVWEIVTQSSRSTLDEFLVDWIWSQKTNRPCCRLIHTSGHMEEIFNPLGVALGENLESGSCHLTLDSFI